MRDVPEAALNIAGARAADLKGQWSWALFQWARDFGGSIIIVFIFAPYFTTSVIGDPIKGQALWGHLNAMAGVFTGLSGPLLGAIADTTGRRKPWLVVFVAVMSLTSILLWWCRPGGAGLSVTLSAAIVVLYTIAYNYSDIFQSSMLAVISPARRLGFLSGLGVALAQASTLLGLAILLYAFMLPGEVNWSLIPLRPLFGIDPAQYENSRISGPFSAIWLLVFFSPSLPVHARWHAHSRSQRLGCHQRGPGATSRYGRRAQALSQRRSVSWRAHLLQRCAGGHHDFQLDLRCRYFQMERLGAHLLRVNSVRRFNWWLIIGRLAMRQVRSETCDHRRNLGGGGRVVSRHFDHARFDVFLLARRSSRDHRLARLPHGAGPRLYGDQRRDIDLRDRGLRNLSYDDGSPGAGR